ncbi:hypothetical protein [uncultured Litoreibacter sp.]|uniref:hypothetical protein n=1 Tax=uncultured Litoreibacter sp. TaxID=1392394 RepID=UPI00260EBE78|nr:hypothetical protein [uncultured Litoreibacter sp.]
MRNIIFTSLLAFALPAQAQDMQSCYARTYSDAHLAKHPAQVVKAMVMAFELGDAGDSYIRMSALIADGGHAKGGPLVGQWVDQGLYCFEGSADQVGTRCGIDCDGGVLEVTKVSTQSLTFRTTYLTVGEREECGGSIDLAEEIGKPVSYRLDRVDPAICTERLR